MPSLIRIKCSILNAIDKISFRLGSNPTFPSDMLSIEQSCEQFIRFKDILDEYFNADSAWRITSGFIDPDSYFSLMLPGVFTETKGPRYEEEIDPNFVLGSPWREHLPPQNFMEKLDEINFKHETGRDVAMYRQVSGLPLYLAKEGKNRVELFRYCRRKIHATVSVTEVHGVPYICRDLSGSNWIAVFTEKDASPAYVTVPFPTVTLPVYKILGAEIYLERLPIVEADAAHSLHETTARLAHAIGLP